MLRYFLIIKSSNVNDPSKVMLLAQATTRWIIGYFVVYWLIMYSINQKWLNETPYDGIDTFKCIVALLKPQQCNSLNVHTQTIKPILRTLLLIH